MRTPAEIAKHLLTVWEWTGEELTARRAVAFTRRDGTANTEIDQLQDLAEALRPFVQDLDYRDL